MDELLTIAEAAERLGSSVRFPRRLITERGVTFVRVRRHVRIPASALDAYERSSRWAGLMGHGRPFGSMRNLPSGRRSMTS